LRRCWRQPVSGASPSWAVGQKNRQLRGGQRAWDVPEENFKAIPKGRTLDLGIGGGRNALFSTKNGFL